MTLPVFEDPVTGARSVSLTILVVAFSVVLVRWCLGGLTVAGHTFNVVSVSEIEAWMTSTGLLYFGRAATKATEAVAILKAEKTP